MNPRARQRAEEVLPYLPRIAHLMPLVAAGAIGLGLLHLDREALFGRLPMLLRANAILLAVGSAFVLDDEASETLSSSPAPLWVRRTFRLSLAVPLVVFWWRLIVVDVRAAVPVEALPHLEGLVRSASVELSALLAVTLAVSAVAARLAGDRLGGLAAAPAPALVLAAALGLHRYVPMFVSLGDQTWSPVHWRWTGIAAAGLAVLGWASRDPARAAIPRRRGATASIDPGAGRACPS